MQHLGNIFFYSFKCFFPSLANVAESITGEILQSLNEVFLQNRNLTGKLESPKKRILSMENKCTCTDAAILCVSIRSTTQKYYIV